MSVANPRERERERERERKLPQWNYLSMFLVQLLLFNLGCLIHRNTRGVPYLFVCESKRQLQVRTGDVFGTLILIGFTKCEEATRTMPNVFHCWITFTAYLTAARRRVLEICVVHVVVSRKFDRIEFALVLPPQRTCLRELGHPGKQMYSEATRTHTSFSMVI